MYWCRTGSRGCTARLYSGASQKPCPVRFENGCGRSAQQGNRHSNKNLPQSRPGISPTDSAHALAYGDRQLKLPCRRRRRTHPFHPPDDLDKKKGRRHRLDTPGLHRHPPNAGRTCGTGPASVDSDGEGDKTSEVCP